MFVSNNTLNAIKAYFIDELSELYDQNEIEQMVFIVASHFFGWDKLTYRSKLNSHLSESELLKFHWVLKRLKKGEPVQYVLGEAHFYDLVFNVDENVLIPRQETEELVHLILQNLKPNNVLLDIGTGSGVIPTAIKANFTNVRAVGVDVSPEAIKVAIANAFKNQVDVKFEELDILKCDSLKRFKPDVIVSNPPYITNEEKSEIHQNVLDYEPHLALFVEDEDPLVFYRKIATLAFDALPKKGQLFFEINEHFGTETKELLRSIGFSEVYLISDINGKFRIIHAIL